MKRPDRTATSSWSPPRTGWARPWWRPWEALWRINMRKAIRERDTMAAASAWTWWRILPLNGQRSCLAASMPMCSLIPGHRPTWRCSLRCAAPGIPSWAWIWIMADTWPMEARWTCPENISTSFLMA